MIRDAVDGTTLVDDGGRGAGWLGPPWSTFGKSRAVKLTVTPGSGGADTIDWGGPTGFCNVCHSKWQDTETMTHGGSGNSPYCVACQGCHGHGQDWEEYDWENGTHQQWCP